MADKMLNAFEDEGICGGGVEIQTSRVLPPVWESFPDEAPSVAHHSPWLGMKSTRVTETGNVPFMQRLCAETGEALAQLSFFPLVPHQKRWACSKHYLNLFGILNVAVDGTDIGLINARALKCQPVSLNGVGSSLELSERTLDGGPLSQGSSAFGGYLVSG
ncbi:hypothetical protein CYLTODRAFT_445108 [Cylindrobasidium torrendii FP15055 ss-10]|uniref:Uncharacterized protein n=1 Tax=Cylindrobasidium torrendii FP15055 ss-10 TaxID=1314674 RepID=A0A0D7B6L0_9AGAR|nr:hypothetical protein CYLTODRAFT_445108 [Cylindrobasidium torrendii FP15055 ss-10]